MLITKSAYVLHVGSEEKYQAPITISHIGKKLNICRYGW
jgi:predicted transcriptional regulator